MAVKLKESPKNIRYDSVYHYQKVDFLKPLDTLEEEEFEKTSKPVWGWAILSFSAIIGVFVYLIASAP